MSPDGVVVALGGHALLDPEGAGTVDDQRKQLREGLRGVAELARRGHRVALTHGNGPQVGHMLIRARAARGQAYDLPLDVCVAQSQGELGYLILQALRELIATPVVAMITMVRVDATDPALKAATKPVGPTMDAAEAAALRRQGVTVDVDPGRGPRRRVPSPLPRAILGLESVRTLYDSGAVVVVGGGGGIPVVEVDGGRLVGIEAVVDKDHVACELALALGADRLLNLTSVERVALHFRTPWETELATLSAAQASAYQAQGHFAPGTMGPKIEAALRFLAANPHGCVDISTPARALDAWEGVAGTRILAELPRAGAFPRARST